MYRVGIDRSLAPNRFCVWWWHDKAHSLPGSYGWMTHTEFHDHLDRDGVHYLERFRIMASVMEKLHELKQLLKR